MKLNIKENITYAQAGWSVAVILTLTLFCHVVAFPLIIPMLLLFSGLHLFFFKKASTRIFLNTGLLLTLLVSTAYFFKHYFQTPILYLPLASVPMLAMLLFNDLQLSFLISLLSSALVSFIAGPVLGLAQMDLFTIFFMGALTGVYTVREGRTRGQLIGSGLYIGIMQVVSLMLLHPDKQFMMSASCVVTYIRPLLINGFAASFVVLTLLKVFEFLFGVLTNFSLLELSDFNQPLLKRMILEAPGTYHHSLVVSNIAEAAADSIGANGLLTRVGAYYHDIGKMLKPEYYSENQLVGGNKHDKIEPSISRLVILNHVKEGMELARKNKLNPRIVDFIPQHHGTSLMYFFYQKALEDAEDQSSVKEENYRYPGPKPQSRETAIVLLADSVEAAVRALDEPVPNKIAETVR